MNIREAILKAADQFDRAPHLFNFWKTKTPECGSPGCAIGWMAAFRGMTGYVHEICQKALGVSDRTFYDRMRDLDYGVSACNAAEMATGLRLYANKYHPADKGTEELVTLDPAFLAFRNQFVLQALGCAS